MREIKSINGLRVISVEEGADLGVVSQVVVDLAQGIVLGLVLGNGPGEHGVAAAEIKTIGADVIMVASQAVARPLSELPELEARRHSPTAPLAVFTSSGKRLGTVSAILIDPWEKVVTRYEVSGGALKDLADGVLILPILPGTVHGKDAVIVPDEQVRQLGRESGGLRARLGQWGETARKQVEQVSEQAEKLYESSAETIKKEAGVVRNRAGELSAQAQEAWTKLGEKEDAAPAAEGETEPPAEDAAPSDDMVPVAPDNPEAEAIVPVETDETDEPQPESKPTE